MFNVIYLLSKFGKIYLAERKLLKPPTFYSPPMSLIHLSSTTDSCITHSAKLHAILPENRNTIMLYQPSPYLESPEADDNDGDWYNEHNQHKQE